MPTATGWRGQMMSESGIDYYCSFDEDHLLWNCRRLSACSTANRKRQKYCQISCSGWNAHNIAKQVTLYDSWALTSSTTCMNSLKHSQRKPTSETASQRMANVSIIWWRVKERCMHQCLTPATCVWGQRWRSPARDEQDINYAKLTVVPQLE